MDFKESLDLLISGTIKGISFFEGKENYLERVITAKKYLDGKGVFYKTKELNHHKYGRGVSFEIITDKEYIDNAEEYLHCIYLFGDTTDKEYRMLKKIWNEKLPKPYYYYTTKEEINEMRFDYLYYMTRVNMEVYYDKGLVIIR